MYYTIYKITNKLNGKFYIGKHKTKNLDDGYMGSGKLIGRAIEKYGIENFEKEILHVFETEIEMNEAEARLVILSEDSYNLCPGGHGGFGYINGHKMNRKCSREELLKQLALAKDALKEKRKDEEWFQAYKLKISKSLKGRKPGFKGKKHTQHTKTLISLSKKEKNQGKGSSNSQYGTRWITDGITNKKISNLDMLPYGWRLGRVINNSKEL